MATVNHLRPSPMQTVETKPFWEAAARGELLFGHCDACGERHYYPRMRCPYCFSDRVQWLAAAGSARIYAYSVVRRADPPYVSAYVTREEGVTVFTNIVDCDPDALAIGQAVRLTFEQSADGQAVPVFRPLT